MIQGNSAYVEKMLKISIEHNRNTLKRLNELIKKTIDDRISYFNEWNKYQKYGKVHEESIKDSAIKDSVIKKIRSNLLYFENGDIVIYRDSSATVLDGIITNIIHVNEKSQNGRISSLVQQLNSLYNEICNINISMIAEGF